MWNATLKTPYFQHLWWVWQILPKNGNILQMSLKFAVPLEGLSCDLVTLSCTPW
jgi:hypothetical protein